MDTEPGTLVIRADAGERMGIGHVLRSLAIAQAWRRRGGRSTFVVTPGHEPIAARLASDEIEMCRQPARAGSEEDATYTGGEARRRSAAALVVDGYHLGPEYRRTLAAFGVPILLADDLGDAGPYDEAWILHHAPGIGPELYRDLAPRSRLLAGPRYTLIREEFQRARRNVAAAPAGASRRARILVTLGGADPQGATPSVVAALASIRGPILEVAVVVGPTNPCRSRIEDAARSSGPAITVLPPQGDMAAVMAGADLAISASGGTALELAYLGVPSILLVAAENQRPVAAHLAQEGAALLLGDVEALEAAALRAAVDSLLADPERRARMSERGRGVIDGRGAERVVAAIRRGSG